MKWQDIVSEEKMSDYSEAKSLFKRLRTEKLTQSEKNKIIREGNNLVYDAFDDTHGRESAEQQYEAVKREWKACTDQNVRLVLKAIEKNIMHSLRIQNS